MAGEMVFNTETDRSRAVLTIRRPDSDGSEEMQMIADGTVVYMRSSQFGSLPDGREWMALDLSLGRDLSSQLPANGDAMGELELLEAATGGVQKLGKEYVRGVPTMRYRGTVDSSEEAEQLREEGAEELASNLENGRPLQVEAWIDAEGLVRRMRFVKSESREGGEGSMTIDVRVDFYDFSVVPEIDVPEEGEVFDATAFAKEELGLSDGD